MDDYLLHNGERISGHWFKFPGIKFFLEALFQDWPVAHCYERATVPYINEIYRNDRAEIPTKRKGNKVGRYEGFGQLTKRKGSYSPL